MYGHSNYGYSEGRDQYGYGQAHGRARDQNQNQNGQAGREWEPRDQYGYHGQSGQSGQSSGRSYNIHRYEDQTGGRRYGQGSEKRRTWTRSDGAGGYGQGSEGRRFSTHEDGARGGTWVSANERSGGGATWATTLSPFVKDFLSYSAPCRAVGDSQVAEFRRDKEIQIMKGEESCPNPVIKFEAGGFPDYITKEVIKAGFTHPTPIQAQSFTIALSGQVRRLSLVP